MQGDRVSVYPLAVPGMPMRFGKVLSFLRAPLAVAVDAFLDWKQGPVSRVDLPGGLAEHATMLLPLDLDVPWRDLLVGTVGDEWTALFESTPVIRPPSGPRVLNRWLDTEVVEVWLQLVPEGTDPTDELGLLRVEYRRLGMAFHMIVELHARYTSPARYAFKGPVQPWEDSELVGKRFLRRDQSTPEYLKLFCAHLGIDPVNLDFYSGPSVFVGPGEPEVAEDSGQRKRFRLPWSKGGGS